MTAAFPVGSAAASAYPRIAMRLTADFRSAKRGMAVPIEPDLAVGRS
jgi:hypothetical protein